MTLCGTDPCSPVKMIAAGAFQTIAGVFSPTNQYQVDVSKDLLLIYNTGSSNNASSNVFNYYTNNRPLVSMANVLPISCTNVELIIPYDFTNQILAGNGSSWHHGLYWAKTPYHPLASPE